MDHSQLSFSTSPYQGLYDLIIPKDHFLRKVKENIDFSFVNPMLKEQYCEHFGRPAKEPEMMFKLLFLKKLYDLSDERLISNAQTDMSYKFFLNLDPEAKMINPSLLTKFRKTRITEDILEDLLQETIRQAIDKGIIKSGTIIVDATHTNASVRASSPTYILRQLCKNLRKEIYKQALSLSEKFPEKPSLEATLEEEISYTEKLISALEKDIEKLDNKKLKEQVEQIKQLLEEDEIRKIRSKDDQDARVTLDTIKIEESLKGEWVYTSYEPVNDGRCSTCNYFGYVRFNSTSRWLVLKDNYVVSVYDTHDDFHYSDHYRSGGNPGRWEYVNGTLTITFGNAAQVYTVSDGKLIWQNINEEVYTKCE